MTDRDMRQELEQALNALDNPHWCKTAVASVLDLLSSEAGVQLLEQQLAFAAGPRDVRLAGWAVELESEGAKFRKAFHEQVDRVLEALFPDYRPDRPRADDEVDPRVIAEKLVAGLSLIVKDRKVVAQVLELLDDVGLIKQVARDGSIAAIITLILSARANSKAYHHGQLRWDDALDNMALDTVKAGITGIIVSAIVGAPGLATGGAALAYAIPLALVVHAVVSSFVDATYEHVLGGRLIREARGRHATYLEVAAYIRDELYPELERAEALGLLVELAMELRAHPDSRESLVEEALFIIGAMQARPKLLTRGDEKRSSNLAWALREYLSDKRIETQLELPELERLSVNVHKLYWEAKLREPKKKVVPKFVLDGLRLRPKHEPLVSHLVELEQKRPHREAPLAFQIKTKVAKGLVKTVPKQLLASDLVEALRFYCMMRDEAWEVREAPPEISHHGMAITSWRPNTIDDTKEPMQERLGKVLGPYSGWDHPLAQECWNPCYRTGFAQELALGEWRVFEIDVSADHRPHYRYVAIPSARGRKRAQEKDTELLIRSLGQDHPYFRTLGPKAMRSVRELDVVEHLQQRGGIFAATAFRCVPLELYTATVIFQDRDGSRQYLSQEGYFHSLYEAYTAFETKLDRHILVGVRPGGLVLSDELRDRLKNAGREEFWSLQRELISQVTSGLRLLEELSNDAENRIQALAGSGVVISAWWFLNSHTRRELVGLLENAQVLQSVRFELMEAMLVLHRLHALNRLVFEDTPRVRHLRAIEAGCQMGKTELTTAKAT